MKLYNQNLKESIAEGLGTFTLVALGCAANANSKLGNLPNGVAALAWGMALTAAIYVCGGVSGGHVNPGVTLGLASIGKLPWYKVPHYIISQFIGAFLGALIVYLVYYNAIAAKFSGFFVTGDNATADIFGTFPAPDSTTSIAFLEQVVACFFFLLLINAITDKRNMNTPKGLIPIAIGLTNLTLCILTFSYNSGGPINPARDFAPRLISIFSYGSETFTAGHNYFWVPLLACPIGSILGSVAYKFFIEKHWSSDLDPTTGTDPNSNEFNPVKFNYKINRLPGFRKNKY